MANWFPPGPRIQHFAKAREEQGPFHALGMLPTLRASGEGSDVGSHQKP